MPRTEPSLPFLDVSRGGKELLVALLAVSPDGSDSISPEGDEWLSIPDQVVGSIAEQIALVTRGNKIGRVVIPPVVVEMVNDDAVTTWTPSQFAPAKRPAAPVAWMDPRSDLGVKDEPMLKDQSVCRGQRMTVVNTRSISLVAGSLSTQASTSLGTELGGVFSRGRDPEYELALTACGHNRSEASILGPVRLDESLGCLHGPDYSRISIWA